MYKGKRLKHEKRKCWNKSVGVLVSLLLLVGITISGTLAFLTADDGPVKNTFTPSEVTTLVNETVSGTTKSAVKIKNTGDTTAYIRAAVVVTWQDKDGNVYGKKPVPGENGDYTISYNESVQENYNGGKWTLAADGFWYWNKPVKSDAEDSIYCTTGILISSCTPVDGKAPTDYHLAVEIIGSGIQSVPTSVVTEEWSSGVRSVSDDDTLVIKQ